MELTTQCPECGTPFAVKMEQLQLRKGYIRCINCAHIFDGYEAIVPQGAAGAAPDSPLPAPRPDTPARALPPQPQSPSQPQLPPIRVGRPHGEAPQVRVHEPVHFIAGKAAVSSDNHTVGENDHIFADPQEELSDDPVWRDIHSDEMDRGFQAGEPGAPEPIGVVYGESRKTRQSEALPDFLEEEDSRPGLAPLFWGGMTLMAAALLIAQAAYIYRVEIASQVPVLRPVLEQACQSFGCTVGYPRRIQSIVITDSSLQAESGQKEGSVQRRMRLRVVLRNTDDKPLEWPVLSLELVDFSGGMVARHLLNPADYLPADKVSGPFAARSEITAVVPITVDGVQVNGYQLGKFFP